MLANIALVSSIFSKTTRWVLSLVAWIESRESIVFSVAWYSVIF